MNSGMLEYTDLTENYGFTRIYRSESVTVRHIRVLFLVDFIARLR